MGQGTRLHVDDTLELVALRNAGTLGFHVLETGKDRKAAELQWLFLPDGGGCLPADNRVALWGRFGSGYDSSFTEVDVTGLPATTE